MGTHPQPGGHVAPTNSAALSRTGVGPTSAVPGIVQKKASGWRCSQQNPMVVSPWTKKAPNSQQASCASLNPPSMPTARMMATGAVAANSQPMKPLAA